jgi:hypothetical protein
MTICVQVQIREKNDKFQQRKLDIMFAAAPRRGASLDAVAADSLAMDMEASMFVLVHPVALQCCQHVRHDSATNNAMKLF